MPRESAYDWDNGTLVGKYTEAVARAGVSGSSLVIDCAAGMHYEEIAYLRGVLYARLNCKKPPFKDGDKVRMKNESVREVCEIEHRYSSPRKPTGVLTIKRIFYWSRDAWAISFEECTDETTHNLQSDEDGHPRSESCKFKAEDFELVEATAPVK